MAANRYAKIEFGRVALLYLQRCRKAFLNEALKDKVADEERGNRHSEDESQVAACKHLREGLAKTAIKGKQLVPHEIAQKCMAGRHPLSSVEGDLMHVQWVVMREGVRRALTEAAAAREAAI